MLRALLMGAVVTTARGPAMPHRTRLRAELFQRYGLDWEPESRRTARRPAERAAHEPEHSHLPDGSAVEVVRLRLHVELVHAGPLGAGSVRRSSSFSTSKPLAMSLE